MKALIGNGGREHAIACKLSEFVACMKANNPGIADLAKDVLITPLDDHDAIIAFCKKHKVDVAIIGPEAPLEAGLADKLWEEGIKAVGPKKNLAMIESSKSFARNLLAEHAPKMNPKFKIFSSMDGIAEFLEELEGFVIKPDGLTGGKGVKVQGDHLDTSDEAKEYCEEVLRTHPAVIIEEKLDGEEFSLMSFSDGKTLRHMPGVQDHKRAYDGDKGPNTGGMGSYSGEMHKLPFLDDEHIKAAQENNELVAKRLKDKTGEPYQGILYGNYILTRDGIKVIEFNARFGDPEAMNVLSLLETDLDKICDHLVQGTLDQLDVEFREEASVCKYVVPEGYPKDPVKDEPIMIKEGQIPPNVNLFYAAIDKQDEQLIMTGSRAIAFVGMATTLEKAERRAETATEAVFGKVFHRRDIGTAFLIQQKIDHVLNL